MEAEERSEVRDMIHDILDGWHEASVSREKLIYISLNNIDNHLEKLNGKAASHEKIINENIPHTFVHCVQAKIIEEIKDIVTGNKAVEKTTKEIREERRAKITVWVKAMGLMVAAFALLLSVYFGFKGNRQSLINTQKIEKLGDPVIIDKNGKIIGTRGVEIKMYPNDFLKSDSTKTKHDSIKIK